jgi:hypothetical protein
MKIKRNTSKESNNDTSGKPVKLCRKTSIAIVAALVLLVIIYFVSSPVSASFEPDEQTKAEVIKTVSSVIKDFYDNGELFTGPYKSTKHLSINPDTIKMAYYLQYQAIEAGTFHDGNSIIASQMHADTMEQKGNRIIAKLSHIKLLNGKNIGPETINVNTENTSDGMLITAFSVDSEAYRNYANEAMQYAKDRDKVLDDYSMVDYNSFLNGKLYNEKLIEERASTNTPEEKQMGNVAVELRYQYYLAQKTHKMPDLSKLIEKNENTELFFYAMELDMGADAVYGFGRYYVEPGSFEIEEKTVEKDGSIKLNIYVNTSIEGGVGEELVLTLKKTGDKYIIIGYDEIGDGYYARLKGIVEDLMKKDKSLSRNEANRLAYEDMKGTLELDSKYLQEHPEIKELFE